MHCIDEMIAILGNRSVEIHERDAELARQAPEHVVLQPHTFIKLPISRRTIVIMRIRRSRGSRLCRGRGKE